VPIGLILNELLTNTLKYAFPHDRQGVVTIKMTSGPVGQFKLIIADNGVGFSDEVAMETPSSLGLRLVKILTRQLDAVLDFQTGSGGTKFTFTFLGTK
jgi:two-component sensor histidine kinase